MALPVLDGNQTATTLSSVVTGGEHIVAHSVVSLGTTAIANITSAVSGSVVSISNFPSTQTIAGAVTANVPLSPDAWAGADGIRVVGNGSDGALRIGGYNPNDGNQLNLEEGGGIPIFVCSSGGGSQPLPISGTVTANVGVNSRIKILDSNGDDIIVNPINGALEVNVKNSVTIGSVPNGSLTTRFGTPTTANVSFATSAVTNANRKYLLIQNVTTGSNVITVGIGFTPTTTQGIQLTAGAGITFESSYIPTGAVYVLSSVTASNFTILEA